MRAHPPQAPGSPPQTDKHTRWFTSPLRVSAAIPSKLGAKSLHYDLRSGRVRDDRPSLPRQPTFLAHTHSTSVSKHLRSVVDKFVDDALQIGCVLHATEKLPGRTELHECERLL